MRVNTILIASLTGAAYARPIETVPDLSIVQDVERLAKLPVAPRQLDALTRPLSGLGGSALGGLQGGSHGQVADSLPVSGLQGLRKRQAEPAISLLNLEKVEDNLGALSLGGLRKRQAEAATDLLDLEQVEDKLGALSLGGLKERQLEQITDQLEDLRLVDIIRRQVQAVTDKLHGLPAQRNTGLVNSLDDETDADEDLPLVGDAISNIRVTKRGLADTTEMLTGHQLDGVTDQLHTINLLGLTKRQLKAVTDLIGDKMVKTVPILGRGLGMQCVQDESGECQSQGEHESTLHATNQPKLDVVERVTDTLGM